VDQPPPDSRRRLLGQVLRLFATVTFRLALLSGLLLAAGCIGALAIVGWRVATAIDQATDRSVGDELAELQGIFREDGLTALEEELAARIQAADQNRRLYLLVDQGGQAMLGNLAVWPSAEGSAEGRLIFRLPSQGAVAGGRVRAASVLLPDCCRLLVGRVQDDRAAIDRVVHWSMAGIGLFCLLVSAALGAAAAHRTLGRLDAMEGIAGPGGGGLLAGRIPLSGRGDEFDRLAVKLNAMLERLQRRLSALKNVNQSIAHDLRTPLTRLRNRLELALMERPSEPSGGEATTMAAAIRDLDGMLATFDALLSIARVEAMSAGQDFAPVPLGRVVADLADLYGPLAEDEGVDLVASVPTGDVTVDGNAQLILQALINLLDNALKHGGNGGRVEVSVERDAGEIRLSVADRGPGIPADQRRSVLDPFARLDGSRQTPGAGLGLSLVAAVADLHEARLELVDNQPGLKVILGFHPKRPVM
jgi:signal transduction histidine kinase